MNRKYECRVISSLNKKNERIQKALLENQASPLCCQFHNDLEAEYCYQDEFFCLLHLPFEEKQRLKLFDKTKQIIESFITHQRHTHFAYISAEGLEIANITDVEQCGITFWGCEIWGLNIKDIIAVDLTITYSTLHGTTKIQGSKFHRMRINDVELSSKLIFSECESDILLLKNSKFYNTLGFVTPRAGLAIEIIDCKLGTLRLRDCEIKLTLSIEQLQAKEIDIIDTKFYLCPSLFNTDLASKTCKISLPNRKAFLLKELVESDLPKRNFLNNFNIKEPFVSLKQYVKKRKYSIQTLDIALADQKANFQEIYNIVKKRGMRYQQGEYYYLMQRCDERIQQNGLLKRLMLKLYRYFSDYGQSYLRPLGWLSLFDWLFFSLFYMKPLNISYKKSLLVALKQIVKPYELLLSDTSSVTASVIGFFQSTFSIVFLALIVIGLHWHFKKGDF